MNVLSRQEKLTVLNMLVEGNSLRSITRLTGIYRTTVMKLMVDVGAKCRDFLDLVMRNLHLTHLECDEIWTFVRKKQRKLRGAEVNNQKIGDQYLFVAFDLQTKLIPSFVIGKRTAEVAELFMDDLAKRLVLPEHHHAGPRPQISTDGFNAYPNAIDGAFAGRVDYGTLIKDFEQSEQPGRYAPPDMLRAIREVITGDITMLVAASHRTIMAASKRPGRYRSMSAKRHFPDTDEISG
jgi:IS1 family transposase